MSAPKTLKVDDVEYVRKLDVESSKMVCVDGKWYEKGLIINHVNGIREARGNEPIDDVIKWLGEDGLRQAVSEIVSTDNIVLKSPVKALVDNGTYLAVLEDADGVCHFWNKDGSYDGYDRECSKT